jgi:hypothetical protein
MITALYFSFYVKEKIRTNLSHPSIENSTVLSRFVFIIISRHIVLLDTCYIDMSTCQADPIRAASIMPKNDSKLTNQNIK